jgi:hypothetical protein
MVSMSKYEATSNILPELTGHRAGFCAIAHGYSPVARCSPSAFGKESGKRCRVLSILSRILML